MFIHMNYFQLINYVKILKLMSLVIWYGTDHTQII